MALAAASPQRPTAIILTVSFDLRFYEYRLGVIAIKVSKKYSVHVTQSSKSSCIRKKKQKLDTNLKIVLKFKLLHIQPILKIIKHAVIFKIL